MTPAAPLTQAYATLRQEHPHLRIRDAAAKLGVTELELVLLDARTVRLRRDPQALLEGLHTVGDTMALTRNPWCVHERHGAWSAPSFPNHASMGLVVGADIDLRLFLSQWVHLVHTEVDNARGPLRSFQVFDTHGVAVQKVYATAHTDALAWDKLVASLTDATPGEVIVAPPRAVTVALADHEVALESLRTGWAGLKDTHDFFLLLRAHKATRTQALRLAGEPWSRPVDGAKALDEVLQGAAADGQSIMVFVGNPGCIQIHTGPVKNVAWRGTWINVLDPLFNLHLDTAGIADAWVVRKPTVDGDVNSLELFSADGELIAQLFGERKPGRPEDPEWTARLERCRQRG